MGQLNKLLYCFVLLALAGCGVKGRPLPPLNPAPLGRGEPVYSDATKKKAPVKKLRTHPDEDETPYPEDEK